MSAINPFSGYVAQGAQVERLQAAEKTRQVRREQVLSKNVAARDDELEHQVENTEGVTPTHDDDEQPRQQQHPQRQDHPTPDGDGPPHIDVTA